MKGVPGATVLVEGSKVCVIVTDCFESGSERLKPSPDVRAAIRATAAAILRHPEAQVAVVGHTDSKPIQKKLDKWPTNVELSKARAEQVATAISTDGVEKTRMQVDGKGAAEMLVVPEKTAADRARNRRVEVQFHFNS
jgi:OmpA-OmpF porin, OOP family